MLSASAYDTVSKPLGFKCFLCNNCASLKCLHYSVVSFHVKVEACVSMCVQQMDRTAHLIPAKTCKRGADIRLIVHPLSLFGHPRGPVRSKTSCGPLEDLSLPSPSVVQCIIKERISVGQPRRQTWAPDKFKLINDRKRGKTCPGSTEGWRRNSEDRWSVSIWPGARRK